jgi:hypothetical protein
MQKTTCCPNEKRKSCDVHSTERGHCIWVRKNASQPNNCIKQQRAFCGYDSFNFEGDNRKIVKHLRRATSNSYCLTRESSSLLCAHSFVFSKFKIESYGYVYTVFRQLYTWTVYEVSKNVTRKKHFIVGNIDTFSLC